MTRMKMHGAAGVGGDEGGGGDAEPAIRAECDPLISPNFADHGRGGVAVYWHGVPRPAEAAATLALARTQGPVLLQRVVLLQTDDSAGPRLPRLLRQAGAEVVLCAHSPRAAALADAWHVLVVDDLVRHPAVHTVVLASAPAVVHSRVAPAVRSALLRCLLLHQPGADGAAQSMQAMLRNACDVQPAAPASAPASSRRQHQRRLVAAPG